jgi:putative DNA primase/helicase
MPLASRLSAAEIARALVGRRSGTGFTARCPAHDDNTPSLSIADSADGKVLVHCHAGCSQEAVIAALRARNLWYDASRPATSQRFGRRGHPACRDVSSDDQRRRDFALEIWAKSIPIEGTTAEAYLRGRGITMSLPPTLRFHERLPHIPSNSLWPAMLALITDGETGEPIGIHRTYLTHDGIGKAPVTPSKMMLGRALGGAVRLADAVDSVMVGEGIETALSAMQATGVPAWAALSANGIRSLTVPPGIETLTLLADGDPTGEHAAASAARRLKSAVRTVRVARAPPGCDFNDILMQKRNEAR